MKIALVVACAGLLLAGCAGNSHHFAQEQQIPQGPAPKIISYADDLGPLSCVVAQLSPAQRSQSFGVLGFKDDSGSENRVGNDSFGTFNTQGAAAMLTSALVKSRITTVEYRPEFQQVINWLSNKTDAGKFRTQQVNASTGPDGKETGATYIRQPTGNVRSSKWGLIGSIPSTDFMPGGGASVGAFGVSVGGEANWAVTTMDLHAVEMPNDNMAGGTVRFGATVEKQVMQDSFRLGLSRYIGDKPTFVHFDMGGGRREPMKYQARAMVHTALAYVLAQMYNIGGCFPTQEPTTVASVTK
jgi:curli biogenesis system outer membrane secretion channel CsgG